MLIQFGYFNKKEEMSKYAFVQNVHTCRKLLVRLSKNVFFQIWNTNKVVKWVLSGETLTLLHATNTCALLDVNFIILVSFCS